MLKNKIKQASPKTPSLLSACVRQMGSMPVAVGLISIFGIILILSTTLESRLGTAFAQRFFYQAGWFDALLALLGLNILCATLLRLPFHKRHVAFVTTHTGILILLAGSLLTRLQSVEGQMMLYEGETSDQIRLNQYQLAIHKDGQSCPINSALSPGKMLTPIRIGPNLQLSIRQILESAAQQTEVTDGPPASPSNPAIRLTLSSKHQNFEESFWLVVKNPLIPVSDSVSFGPLLIELKTSRPKDPSTTPTLELHQKDGERLHIDLSRAPSVPISIGQGGYRLISVGYYPDARVDGKKLVSISDKPLNPAVEFEVENSSGQRCRYVKFANFPNFDSIHKTAQSTFENLETFFTAPTAVPQVPCSLQIFSENGQWSHTAKSSKKETSGSLKQGQTYKLDFMDFTFRVDRLLAHAAVSKKISRSGAAEAGPAAEVALVLNGRTLDRQWVLADSPASFFDGTEKILVTLEPKTQSLPFSLTLKAFRKIDYPGTHNPSAYESDVTLKNPRLELTLERTIAMNKTLDHDGYRIFQTSFLQETHGPQASVFTVAKNPGIWPIYTGCSIMFVGILMGFYLTDNRSKAQIKTK